MLFCEKLCESHGIDPIEVYGAQFSLSRDRKHRPSGMAQHLIGEWSLCIGPELAMARANVIDNLT